MVLAQRNVGVASAVGPALREENKAAFCISLFLANFVQIPPRVANIFLSSMEKVAIERLHEKRVRPVFSDLEDFRHFGLHLS